MKLFVVSAVVATVLSMAYYYPLWDYQPLSAQEKFEFHWNKILTTEGKSTDWLTGLDLVKIFFVNLQLTFLPNNDVMPKSRKKYIHTQGVIANFSWIPVSGHPYTGLFDDGTDYGFIRLSGGGVPTETNLKPAVSIKMFRDGEKSANLFAMYALKGQESLNFFKNDFKNHVPPPTDFALKLLVARFKQAGTADPGKIGLSDIAKTTKGQRYFPYVLTLRPNPDIKKVVEALKEDIHPDNWLEQFKVPQKGNVLYKVYAKEFENSNDVHVANIRLNSNLMKSTYADSELFFQHQRIEDDYKFRPELDPNPLALGSMSRSQSPASWWSFFGVKS